MKTGTDALIATIRNMQDEHDQLRNIVYRLENRILEWTDKCKELEARLETTQHRLDYVMDHSAIQTILSGRNCNNCD